ncbi:MAG: hypothetical protein K2Q22_04580, partial [Cytophagales bacterium]|nr:hypothetical protein [Cytophagales bacterium]
MKKWVFISFMVLIVITMGANESRAQYITFFSAFRSNEVRADDFYEKKQYARALELYQLANKKDPTNQFLKLKMAKTFFRLQRTRESEAMYASIIKNPKVVRPDDRIEYIQCLLENGKIEIGKAALNQFAKDNPKNETAKLLQARFLNLNKFYKDSGLYKVKRLLFNDKSADFSPSFYQDGIAYVSSRSEPLFNIHEGAEDSTQFFDLFKISLIHDSIIGKPEELDQSLNSYYHQGPVTFFDNDRKMIFTSNRQEGLGASKNLHLYMAERDSGSVKWKNVKLLPFNSNNYSTAHPAMNSAGNMLYFSSDMNGGQGGSDLYQVTYTNGKWGSPSNLGKGVNTKGDEYFPFILNDSVLFFASDGLPGLG